MTFRRSYWSCSKFAAWLRSFQDIPSPYALSSDEWEAYKEEHKGKLCYKMAEWLDNVQEIVYYPVDLVHKVYRNVHNLWIGTHCLKTSLKKGQWHEFDKRIKYGIMENFIDFVEKDLYNHALRWNGAYLKKKGIDKDINAVLKFWQELQDEGRGDKPWKEILDSYYKAVYIIKERVDAWDMEFETSQEYIDLKDKQDKEDEEVLIAVIKFRKFLWT
jgi:hypothetical protein